MPETLRVVLTPGVAVFARAREAALLLSGADSGEATLPLDLTTFGVRTLRRALSQAEVHYLRRALLGLAPGEELRPRAPEDRLVGLICSGRVMPGTADPGTLPSSGGGGAFAVADHANLTWRSPLRGPNDERLGPRFPVTAGIYDPEVVQARLGSSVPMVEVACVADDAAPTPFEAETAVRNGFTVLSTELAPVALVAAHLGFHLAALVLDTGGDDRWR